MSIDSSFDSEESFENEAAKSPETLEREIDAQRSSIGNIVDALENKFSPGQIVDQALAYAKENGGEFFGNLGTSIKTNPVPAVLTSVGVLWMMLGQNRGPTSSSFSGPSSLDQLGSRISGAAQSLTDTFGNAKSRIEETAHRMKDKAGQATDKAGDLSNSVSDTLSSTGQRMNQSSHDMTDQLQAQARKAKSSVSYMLREQPLALAAIGVALGAAIGAALPSTERENRMMGQVSDQLTDKAKGLATEGYDKATEMGKELADHVTSTDSATTENADRTQDDAPRQTSGLG